MTARLAEIWRYPVKSHGRETLSRIDVTAGATLPWDRHWAVAHEAAEVPDIGWSPCQAFSRVSKAPRLMAISSSFEPATGAITMSHPDLGSITFRPEADEAEFLDWSAPLIPKGRARSARIVRGGKVGMTDSDYPSISILSTSSLDALGAMAGAPLAAGRFRGNLWVDGLAPWSETGWVGKCLVVGDVRFDIRERIKRCRATEANPDTGQRDEPVLAHLEVAGQEAFFGLHAVAATSGAIKVGDPVTLAA